MTSISLHPLKKPVIASVHIPGSKSYTNRALLIAALAQGRSTLVNPLESDDTNYMKEALKDLGINISVSGTTWTIDGNGGKFTNASHPLYLGNAGTAMRFLTATMTVTDFETILVGDERMNERPIQDLIDGLNQLGGTVESINKNSCPPVRIRGTFLAGGTATMKGTTSSQYFSAILINGPYAKQKIHLIVQGDLVSKPYIDATLKIMKDFGVHVKNKNYQEFFINPEQHYEAQRYEIEADASSASYFFGLAALTESRITVDNLSSKSAQADIQILPVLEKMGAQIEHSKSKTTVIGPASLSPPGWINLKNMPDGAMTVSILCACAQGRSELHGLENLRVKESNRLKALCSELKRIGCDVEEIDDGLIIEGNPDNLHGANIETYNDHRIAMCFAIAGMKVPGIKISNPECVSKTYPRFFEDLFDMCCCLRTH